jgi:hypothetical protein
VARGRVGRWGRGLFCSLGFWRTAGTPLAWVLLLAEKPAEAPQRWFWVPEPTYRAVRGCGSPRENDGRTATGVWGIKGLVFGGRWLVVLYLFSRRGGGGDAGPRRHFPAGGGGWPLLAELLFAAGGRRSTGAGPSGAPGEGGHLWAEGGANPPPPLRRGWRPCWRGVSVSGVAWEGKTALETRSRNMESDPAPAGEPQVGAGGAGHQKMSKRPVLRRPAGHVLCEVVVPSNSTHTLLPEGQPEKSVNRLKKKRGTCLRREGDLIAYHPGGGRSAQAPGGRSGCGGCDPRGFEPKPARPLVKR